MNTKELEDRLFELKRNLFILEMKDHWNGDDFSMASDFYREIEEVENKLKTEKGE